MITAAAPVFLRLRPPVTSVLGRRDPPPARPSRPAAMKPRSRSTTAVTVTLPMRHPLLQAARLGLGMLTAGQVSRHTSTPWSNILEDTHGNDKATRPAHHRQLSADLLPARSAGGSLSPLPGWQLRCVTGRVAGQVPVTLPPPACREAPDWWAARGRGRFRSRRPPQTAAFLPVTCLDCGPARREACSVRSR